MTSIKKSQVYQSTTLTLRDDLINQMSPVDYNLFILLSRSKNDTSKIGSKNYKYLICECIIIISPIISELQDRRRTPILRLITRLVFVFGIKSHLVNYIGNYITFVVGLGLIFVLVMRHHGE